MNKACFILADSMTTKNTFRVLEEPLPETDLGKKQNQSTTQQGNSMPSLNENTSFLLSFFGVALVLFVIYFLIFPKRRKRCIESERCDTFQNQKRRE